MPRNVFKMSSEYNVGMFFFVVMVGNESLAELG